MEIAQGSLRRNAHSVALLRDLTPAETLLLHGIHFRNSQGSPLGDDFAVYGEAVTVEDPAKPAEDAYVDVHGRDHKGTPAVPAKTHPRTNAEEVERLRKKYSTAKIWLRNGDQVSAFEGVFPGIMPKLPQTFDEIEDAVGMKFPQLSKSVKPLDDSTAYRDALLKKPRHEICKMALDRQIHVAVTDDTAELVDKIIEADSKKAEAAEVKLADMTKSELLTLASNRQVEVKPSDSKADIIAAIELAGT